MATQATDGPNSGGFLTISHILRISFTYSFFFSGLDSTLHIAGSSHDSVAVTAESVDFLRVCGAEHERKAFSGYQGLPKYIQYLAPGIIVTFKVVL